MFNKLINVKKFNDEIINIDDFVKLVRNNDQKTLIDKIRSIEYKSKEYNALKLRVSAMTPHGMFYSLKNEGLNKLSGYLYYDIDGLNERELLLIKNKLIETELVSFICRSVGNRGLSFLVKYDTKLIPNDTFNLLYVYVRKLFLDLGFNIDLCANGLVRKLIISSDPDLFYSDKVSLSIDLVSLENFKSELKNLNKIKVNRREKENNDIIPNDTFFEVINEENLKTQIRVETLYTKEINGDFIIDEIDYYKISLPRIIKDGTKHKLYIRLINALYYINNNINKNQVYSYLYHINNKVNPKMNEFELKRLVNYICNNIEETGEILIKPRVKKLHFNPESNITKKQKKSMGAQLAAKLKTNKTLKLIEEARLKCLKENIVPTQKEIVKMTGLSIATIKRNWNKEYVDIKDLNIKKDDDDIEVKISVEEFLKPKTQIINYRGVKLVEIDEITDDDKKCFISLINQLKSQNIEPCESIMISLNYWNEWKTWYLYDKWLKIETNKKINVEDYE